jgi:hypothetical protein
MKTLKSLFVAALTAGIALAVLGAGLAFAQGSMPWDRGTAVPGHGPGMMGQSGWMGGRGMMGASPDSMQGMHAWMQGTGGMHTIMWDGLAEELGLTPEALQTALAEGQTLLDVAAAQGIDRDGLVAAMARAMQAGLDQAVADGVLTREQSGQMLAHMVGHIDQMIDNMGTCANLGDGAGMMGPGGMMGMGAAGHGHRGGGMMYGAHRGGMMGGAGTGTCPLAPTQPAE